MTFARRRLIAAFAAAPAAAALSQLGGCASAAPSGSFIGHPAAVKPAGFKLDTVQVRWQENPGFTYRVSYERPKYAVDTSMSKVEGEKAKAYMDKLMALYRANTVTMSTDRLLGAGVRFGPTHTIALLALRGHFNHAGGTCGMTMRASILDANRQLLYTVDIDSDSAWHWKGFGVPDPDEGFVRNFAEAMVVTFKQAGLLA